GSSSGASGSVSVPSVAHGTVRVSAANAAKGSTVTLTVQPAQGYVLSALTVTDRNGKTVALTKTADDRYTFTMPAGKVTVQPTFEQAGTGFADVAADAFYAEAVAWAVESGITNGTSADRFSPDMVCTRGQIVTLLWRAAGSPKAAAAADRFADVATDAFYADAVAWAVEQGITNGTGAARFSPAATCDRAQMATMLYRFAGAPAVEGAAAFTDVPADAYYADAVQWAVDSQVTNGTGVGVYSPQADCTRGQTVTFLFRLLAR
ncbi:MAG: S-layer homology domain-containing protein, partial [Eubacteriales bacterium]|nr:S-layer homology domain-containing protein [Eubacteriales bacterium]